MEIKRCARCGGFFETVNDVCNNCVGKDNKELGKLKNFLSGYDHSEEITRRDISNNTGITMKNLNRFLSGEEFCAQLVKWFIKTISPMMNKLVFMFF